MYTIKHAAQQVGIPAATLRAWERRYGVISPQRTDGGYRIYDEDDVNLLRSMKELIAQGWQPGLAAREAARRAKSVPVGLSVAMPAEDHSSHSRLPSDFALELIAAAKEMDVSRLTSALDQLFALNSFEVAVAQHLFPGLEALGDAWADGRVTVAGEHLASNAVMRRLAVAYEAAATYGHGPRVALGLAPGCRHEIGLLAFAVTGRRHGMSTDYLGADLPIEDWMTLADQRDLAAVVIAVPTLNDVTAANRVINSLQERRPSLVVAAGGAEQTCCPDGTLLLGHDLTIGAELLSGGISATLR